MLFTNTNDKDNTNNATLITLVNNFVHKINYFLRINS